jgi:enoyl-CoA hydratase/carnithine racemase
MSDILTSVDAGVMTIMLNRVEKKNAITSAMYTAMADALKSAADDAAVRVVVFQGQETFFCAGNDIGDFLNHPPTADDSPVYRFLKTISTFPKPLVAAVCGVAVGVGTTLLLHCDLVYAGDNAAFSLPFANLGLCPEAASSLLAPQMFGYHRAAEVLLLWVNHSKPRQRWRWASSIASFSQRKRTRWCNRKHANSHRSR